MSAQSSNVPFSKEEGTCNGAEEELSLSYKQTKRLWKRYLKYGPKDLISKKRGRPSNYQFPPELKQDALALIKEKYKELEIELICAHSPQSRILFILRTGSSNPRSRKGPAVVV